MRKFCKNLDERQLQQRGDVFQHTTILLFVLLMINAFLMDEGFVWAEGMWENLLILWAALTLCFSEFIIREITPMGSGMGTFYTAMGCAGAFIIILNLSRIAASQKVLINGYTLTQYGATTIEGSLMIFIFLMFLGKKVYNHRKAGEEDEA